MKYELEILNLHSSFESVLYSHRSLTHIRTISFNSIIKVKIAHIIKENFRTLSQVQWFIDSLVKELMYRIDVALKHWKIDEA